MSHLLFSDWIIQLSSRFPLPHHSSCSLDTNLISSDVWWKKDFFPLCRLSPHSRNGFFHCEVHLVFHGIPSGSPWKYFLSDWSPFQKGFAYLSPFSYSCCILCLRGCEPVRIPQYPYGCQGPALGGSLFPPCGFCDSLSLGHKHLYLSITSAFCLCLDLEMFIVLSGLLKVASPVDVQFPPCTVC